MDLPLFVLLNARDSMTHASGTPGDMELCFLYEIGWRNGLKVYLMLGGPPLPTTTASQPRYCPLLPVVLLAKLTHEDGKSHVNVVPPAAVPFIPEHSKLITVWRRKQGILLHQQIRADNNVHSESGWRPIFNEGSFNDFRRNVIRPNTQGISAKQSADNIVLGDFVKIIDPPEVTRINGNDFQTLYEYNRDQYRETITEQGNNIMDGKNNYVIEEDGHNKFYQNHFTRAARKMTSTSMENTKYVMNDLNQNTDNNNLNKSNVQISETDLDEYNNKYEVIEINDEKDLLTMDQKVYYAKNIESTNYFPIDNGKKNSLGSKLLNILANYNIRTSDKLTNYPLSLRQNSRNTENRDLANHHFPTRSLKYNNANHLLVDPLLAVLLSNYGHYITGQFGFQRNYNNLYGYLASNNIHNNKPFGSYKVFSDTDSSF